MKCDIIIPIYNSPEWVDRCLNSILKVDRSTSLGTIVMVNDGSGQKTAELLRGWSQDLGPRAVLLEHSKNSGFVESVNHGFRWFLEESTSEIAVLLNSDCLLADQTLDRLAAHFARLSSLGAICPLSNNAANLSVPIPIGLNFRTFSGLLSRLFPRESRPACTVTGNCLAISRECLHAVGLFDKVFGMGYGEESDFHYRAIAHGFSCRVALDAYVYHFSGASFSLLPSLEQRRVSNHQLFMERWGNVYRADMDFYSRNDPVSEVAEKLSTTGPHHENEVYSHLFLLPGLNPHFGGVRVVVDLCNALIVEGYNPQIYLTEPALAYSGQLLFTPIGLSFSGHLQAGGAHLAEQLRKSLLCPPYDESTVNPGQIKLHPNLSSVQAKLIVGTSWETYFAGYTFSRNNGIPFYAFCQGWELNFNGLDFFHTAQEAMTLPDHVVTVSSWLSRRIRNCFSQEVSICPNGIDTHIFFPEERQKSGNELSIMVYLRGGWVGSIKGDRVAFDVLAMLWRAIPDPRITILAPDHILHDLFKIRYNADIIRTPIDHRTLAAAMKASDIFIDTSPQEGFGLMPLEAMACGCIPIVVENGGSADYLQHEDNGFCVPAGDAESIVAIVQRLAARPEMLAAMRQSAVKRSQSFSLCAALQTHLDTWCKMSIAAQRGALAEELVKRASISETASDQLEIRKMGLFDRAANFFLASALADDLTFRQQTYIAKSRLGNKKHVDVTSTTTGVPASIEFSRNDAPRMHISTPAG